MKLVPLIPLLIAIWVNPVSAADEAAPTAEAQGASHEAHRGHARRAPKPLPLGDTSGARITFWKPDLETQSLVARDQGVTLPRTGIAAYYALVAEWDRPAGREALIRYQYMNGRPTDHSPRELLAAEKTDLEIVPDPLPREHYRYYSNARWGFRVRFQGEAVADASVRLSTEHGSELQATTDIEGRVSFVLPDDFPQVHPGREANAPAQMTLQVEQVDREKLYVTRLSAAYHADPGHWQSTPWGVGVAALGLLAGLAGSLRLRNGNKGNTK